MRWARPAAGLWTAVIVAVTVPPRWWEREELHRFEDRPDALLSLDVLGNLALFVPLGLLLGLAGLGAVRAVGVGLVLSIAIEVTQALTPWEREPQAHDLALNGGGTLVGAALARILPLSGRR